MINFVNWHKMSKNFGIIHIIGIGGIGMSGIAEILHNLGCVVQGSDTVENNNVTRLKQLGIKVIINHQALNIEGVAIVVRSTAVSNDNVEIKAAYENLIPVISRAEMLSELMRLKISISISGTHGKTTTTSLVSMLFEEAGLNPTVINGGIINTKNTNAYVGTGDYLIAEADESDGTFVKIPSIIAIVTNIDPEHLDFYGSFTSLKKAFKTFVENIPFYGFAVLCNDHVEVMKLAKQVVNRRIITYGIDNHANVRALNIRQNADHSVFDVEIRDNNRELIQKIDDIYLPIVGKHNILNSLAAISVATEMKFDENIIKNAFRNFSGVKRRFTKIAKINDVTYIDDYAHHPKEIEVTLSAARQAVSASGGKVIAIVQPHRYTRVQNLFKDFAGCFNNADRLFIADIFPAGENPIHDITSEILVKYIKDHAIHAQVEYINDMVNLDQTLVQIANPGDIVIFMGAGNITYTAYQLCDKIKNQQENTI